MKLEMLGALSIVVFLWAFYPQAVFIGGNAISSVTAQVGVGAGVASNEFTEIVAQIGEKERELEVREAAIAEAEARAQNGGGSPPFTIEWYVTFIAFILLILVLLNFYLDYKHREHSLN
jgi:hypothetical protein